MSCFMKGGLCSLSIYFLFTVTNEGKETKQPQEVAGKDDGTHTLFLFRSLSPALH